MKLAIVVDSSCGLSKKEASDRGWFYLPLCITIDGKEYADGIDLTSENFSLIFDSKLQASTSCTPYGEAEDLIRTIQKQYDFVIIYPISKYLSSQWQNLEIISKDYDNVFVINSKNVAQLIIQELVELENNVFVNNMDVREAIKKIELKDRNNPSILLFPQNMDALVKGGRLSPSAAKMAKLFKIVPVICFQNGKLEKYDKGRVFSKVVVNTTVSWFLKLQNKNNDKNLTFMFLDTDNDISDNLFHQIMEETNYNDRAIRFNIPSVIAIHTGIGAISIFVTKLENDIDSYKFNKMI